MRRHSDSLRGLERALWGFGLGLAGWYAFVSAQAWIFQVQQRAALDRLIVAEREAGQTHEPRHAPDSQTAGHPAAEPALPADTEARVGDPGAALTLEEGAFDRERRPYRTVAPRKPAGGKETRQLIGQLEIPRLQFSAVVVTGDDDATLRVAVGYLPQTPLPWEDGNTALAGHRDSFFQPLRHIKVGDDIRLQTPYGDLRYSVRQILVVEPDATWVLAPQPDPTLTLITCFPFTALGHAPWRFVVQAVRLQ